MRAGSLRIAVAAAFILALLGGAAAGVLATRLAGRTQPAVANESGPLEDLHLTADQRERMRQIWERVRQASDDSYRTAKLLDQRREDRLQGLLTDAQRAEYQKIYQQYQDDCTRLIADRDRAVQKAVEETRKLLSDDQRRRYNAVLAERLGSEAGPRASGNHTLWIGEPDTRPALPAADFHEISRDR